MLSEFSNLERWETNVRELGHGTSSAMDAADAIARAKSLEPIAETGVALNDPQGLKVGMSVTVQPDVDGGEQSVAGTVRSADAETLVIEHTSEEIGTVCVHFPRAGYLIECQ